MMSLAYIIASKSMGWAVLLEQNGGRGAVCRQVEWNAIWDFADNLIKLGKKINKSPENSELILLKRKESGINMK